MSSDKLVQAVIVDDEEQSHAVLNYLLSTGHPDIKIFGHAFNVKEGVRLIEEQSPDLIFLDVEMPDGSGFDLIKAIGKNNIRVIFISGHKNNDYALTAFEFGGLDYLLKPIEADRLKEAIDKAKRLKPGYLDQQIAVASETKNSLAQNSLPSIITINTVEEIIFIKVADIIRLEADKNYTTFYFSNERSNIVASKNLGEFDRQFSLYPAFMRIQKTHLVNLSFADRYKKGDAVLVMLDGSELPVSKNKRKELIKRLKGL